MEWGQQSHFQIHHNPTASGLGIGLVVIETGLLSTIHLGSTEPFVIKDYYPHTLVIAHVFGLTVHILNLSALCFKPYPDMESYSWGEKNRINQSLNAKKLHGQLSLPPVLGPANATPVPHTAGHVWWLPRSPLHPSITKSAKRPRKNTCRNRRQRDR